MRKFIIDTDTAADDAIALITFLRQKTVKLIAITVVAGNVPIEYGIKNAQYAVDIAGTYNPPIFRGMHKPLIRELFTAQSIFGDHGLGNVKLPKFPKPINPGHAIDIIINAIMENPGEVEILAIGPLTNLAMAYLKEPAIAENVKHVFIMGGTGSGPGNVTETAEFNFYVDPEAAKIVLNSGMPLTLVGFDVSMQECFLTEDDLNYITNINSPIAHFCLECNSQVRKVYREKFQSHGFCLPDVVAAAVALIPNISTEMIKAHVDVETKGELTFGQILIDPQNMFNKGFNANICKKVDGRKFREFLFQSLT